MVAVVVVVSKVSFLTVPDCDSVRQTKTKTLARFLRIFSAFTSHLINVLLFVQNSLDPVSCDRYLSSSRNKMLLSCGAHTHFHQEARPPSRRNMNMKKLNEQLKFSMEDKNGISEEDFEEEINNKNPSIHLIQRRY